MTADWQAHARALADRVTHPGSRWYPVVAGTPRHELVPAWWAQSGGEWVVRRGPLADAYADRSLVTRVGTAHADQAAEGDRPTGRVTSSSTLPSLVLTMYRYARLAEGLDVADVDPYLVDAAAQRMSALGLNPTALAVDATGPLPGTYDRIVSMMSVPSIPPSWLIALRPGGRLATTIQGTWMILSATKTPDGVLGQVERDWAGFMAARTGAAYPPTAVDSDLLDERDGEQVGTGRYPVLDIAEAWDLATLLTLTVPGIQHRYQRGPDDRHTAIMTHPDGSWARATAAGVDLPIVHQGGPRRLWDIADAVRDEWARRGWTPWLGARARVLDDGSIRLAGGDWKATVPAATA
ncbi:protein-L-isoaspartate(D-aspartate) O-methyltransferase [Frankia tisae]|uniref:protein-L-isoaspartate(D-aspartate) O-methyltransferase n=1 Tax=Frankia tisae TaxID=2950104 RepID=UPI0021C16A1D|nr:protein-L-isoaspartate(D-aspartate) O-methyltransferase [Frankia tisae]